MDVSDITNGARQGFVTVTEQGQEMRDFSFREYIEHFFSGEYEQNYLSTPANISRFQFSTTALLMLNEKMKR